MTYTQRKFNHIIDLIITLINKEKINALNDHFTKKHLYKYIYIYIYVFYFCVIGMLWIKYITNVDRPKRESY